jgi:hypothetical protein
MPMMPAEATIVRFLEFLDHRLRSEMGYEFREEGGQTIFPVIGASGGLAAYAVVYVGKAGSDKGNPDLWHEVRITADMSPEEFQHSVLRAICR